MWPGPAHGLPPDPGQSSAGALPALHLGDVANTHGVLCSPSDPRAWSCLRVRGGDSPAHHCWTEPRPRPVPAGRVQQSSAPRPEGLEHPELRRPQRLSAPQTHPKGLGHRMGEDGKVSQSGSPPRPAPHSGPAACLLLSQGGLRSQVPRGPERAEAGRASGVSGRQAHQGALLSRCRGLAAGLSSQGRGRAGRAWGFILVPTLP